MAGNRPGPLRWLFYVFGGRLPHRYAQWVLYDLTSRYWLPRMLVRTFVQAVPTWLFLLLPGPLSLTVLLPVFVIIGAWYLAFSFAEPIRVHRLYQHGFAPDMVLHDHDHHDQDGDQSGGQDGGTKN